jgi:UDP-glucose 4-epimerase
MDILVIGGAGYIGAHTVLALIDAGHHVTVFDNLSTGRRENVHAEAHFVEGDLLEVATLERLLAVSRYDAVFHFAALKAAGKSMAEPQRYAHHNTAGSLILLRQVIEHGIPNFVFSSSAAVYGEPRADLIDEDHPTEPTNFYGFTKLQIEQNLAWASRLRGVRYACPRYFNAAGYDPDGRIPGLENGSQNLIPIIMEVAVGKRPSLQIFGNDYPTADGTCIRDYVHVTDLADAHVRALDYLVSRDRDLIVNLGTGKGHSVKEVLERSRLVTGQTIPAETVARRQGDPAVLCASCERAKELLGWRPRFPDLDLLLETTWRVYRQNAES